jgi:uncharacterized protein (TIGR03435 family)
MIVGALLAAAAAQPAAGERSQSGAGQNAGAEATALRFDVVSIKPSQEGRPRGTPLQGGRVVMTGVTLRDLLIAAYQLHGSQLVGGPAWMSSTRFDITAVVENPPSNSAGVRMRLLQSLLADRFGVRVRMDTRERDAYVLRLARPGRPLPRGLQRSLTSCEGVTVEERRANTRAGWPPCGLSRITNTPDAGGRGELTHQMRSALTMDEFAAQLVASVGEPVVNETGLDGRFDIEIEYARPLPGGLPNDVPEGRSLSSALDEQLGLRLDRGRAPVQVLVIDAASLPSTD